MSALAQSWLVRIWIAIGIVVLLAIAWWLLHEPLALLAGPVLLAGLIVYLLNPLVSWLRARGWPRPLGTTATYLVVIGITAGLGFVLGPILGRQTAGFFEELPEITALVQDWVNVRLARLGVDTRVWLDVEAEQTQEAVSAFLEENRDQVLTLLRGAGGVVEAVLHLVLTLVLAPILAFYVLADLPRIAAGIQRLIPPDERSEVVDVAQRIGSTVGAYFRGMLLVALFVGVATAIGLAAVGLPFWALIGVLTGLFNLIPLVGPFVGALLGVVVALTVGNGMGQAIAVLVVMVLVQQVDNHVITPNIVARTVHVHPITVVLALIVAGATFGIFGMLVAIPVVAAVKLIVLYLLATRVPAMSHLAEEPAEGDGMPGSTPPDSAMAATARELRAAWLRRRGGVAASVGAQPDPAVVDDDPGPD